MMDSQITQFGLVLMTKLMTKKLMMNDLNMEVAAWTGHCPGVMVVDNFTDSQRTCE